MAAVVVSKMALPSVRVPSSFGAEVSVDVLFTSCVEITIEVASIVVAVSVTGWVVAIGSGCVLDCVAVGTTDFCTEEGVSVKGRTASGVEVIKVV